MEPMELDGVCTGSRTDGITHTGVDRPAENLVVRGPNATAKMSWFEAIGLAKPRNVGQSWSLALSLIALAVAKLRDVNQTAPPGATTSSRPAVLTAREREVLRLIAAGHTNREIAGALTLSVRTVERHINNLYAKIGARGKADATAYAFRHGLN